jgi:hypothetical protein
MVKQISYEKHIIYQKRLLLIHTMRSLEFKYMRASVALFNINSKISRD